MTDTWKRDCFGDAIMGGVAVRGEMRCATCGDNGVHGCGGPSRRWQEELVAELLRVQALVARVVTLSKSEDASEALLGIVDIAEDAEANR